MRSSLPLKSVLMLLLSFALFCVILWVRLSPAPPLIPPIGAVGGVTAPISRALYEVVRGSVYDGDTLRIIKNNEEIKIRFACIDAPEIGQPGGIEARDYLRKLIEENDNRVSVTETARDRYERTVAELFLPNGNFMQETQTAAGLVWPYEQYKDDCLSWELIERAAAKAKVENLGIWADSGAIPPWEWRRQN